MYRVVTPSRKIRVLWRPFVDGEAHLTGLAGVGGDPFVAASAQTGVGVVGVTDNLPSLGTVQAFMHVHGASGAAVEPSLTPRAPFENVLDEVPTFHHEPGAFLAHGLNAGPLQPPAPRKLAPNER